MRGPDQEHDGFEEQELQETLLENEPGYESRALLQALESWLTVTKSSLTSDILGILYLWIIGSIKDSSICDWNQFCRFCTLFPINHHWRSMPKDHLRSLNFCNFLQRC